MAISPAHKFGQLIGDFLELTIEPLLREFANKNGLYLDKKGIRPARKGKKVKWVDKYGNSHDLDFVLERNGTKNKLGIPVAFIETAWRRYTKHSRNKAQEIQGALLPLAETYHEYSPFIGVVLAGVFTEGALNQLRSLGFSVLFLPMTTLIKAFKDFGIDISADEQTSDKEFVKKVNIFEKLSKKNIKKISRAFLELNAIGVENFFHELDMAIKRMITSIVIFPLYGKPYTLKTIKEAIDFVKNFNESEESLPLVRYEIIVQYNNGDEIKGIFGNKSNAIRFLNNFR